MATDSF